MTPLERIVGGVGAVVCLYFAHQIGERIIPEQYRQWVTVVVTVAAGGAAVTMLVAALYGKTGIARLYDIVSELVRRRFGITIPRPEIADVDPEDTTPVRVQPQGGRHRG